MNIQWQRVGDGYELHVGPTVFRIQRRSTLSSEQKWGLDRHLGLKPRDGKRREEWVILINGRPLRHSYSKATAVSEVNATIVQMKREHERRTARAAQGPSLGLSMSTSQQHWRPAYPTDESVVSRREDLRALSEHLPELRRGRYGSRRRTR